MDMFSTEKGVVLLASLLLIIGAGTGCDLSGTASGPEAPAVDDVVISGTRVGPDFQTTGTFQVVATPLDETGRGLLSGTQASVTLEKHVSVKAHSSEFDPIIDDSSTTEPTGEALAIPIVLDGSGSMANSDSSRNRVPAAKAFINQLNESNTPFESAVFEFPGSSSAKEFSNTDVFAGFTSDIDSLKAGADKAQADGETPMYASLAEVLAHSEAARPAAQYQKGIVLLGDGKPTTVTRRDSVCQDARSKDTPIYGIGIGPASDLSERRDSSAIAEMRGISTCTGGAYQGLNPDSLALLDEAFSAVATASTEGTITYDVKVSDSSLDALSAGDIIEGTLTVESGGTSAQSSFSFRVPDASTSTRRAYRY